MIANRNFRSQVQEPYSIDVCTVPVTFCVNMGRKIISDRKGFSITGRIQSPGLLISGCIHFYLKIITHRQLTRITLDARGKGRIF